MGNRDVMDPHQLTPRLLKRDQLRFPAAQQLQTELIVARTVEEAFDLKRSISKTDGEWDAMGGP